MTANATLTLDFVSDIACPWCAVGLAALEKAINSVSDELDVALHFQPFELNPGMQAGGEDIIEHLTRKYQITPEQVPAGEGVVAFEQAALRRAGSRRRSRTSGA